VVFSSAQPLARRLWRSYLRTALVPLLLVEAVLVGVYLATSAYVAQRTASAMQIMADDALLRQAASESERLDRQLGRIAGTVGLLAAGAAAALDSDHADAGVAASRLQVRPDGVLVAPKDDGGPAVWRGKRTPLTADDQRLLLRGAALDRQLQRMVEGDLQVVSAFLITPDNAIRAWPWFDAGRQYLPDLDLTAFGYYRLAQRAEVTDGEPGWTEPYLDPAGNGWMVSCSAPVRIGPELRGVVGANVTLKGIIDEVLGRTRPWQGNAMLVGQDGCLIAIPPAAERDFGIRELALHRYASSVSKELAKPEELRLERLAPLAALEPMIRRKPAGSGGCTLADGRQQSVSWTTMETTGWRLLLLADGTEVARSGVELGNDLNQLGGWMVAGLVGFYCVYFTVLWFRSARMAQRIALPLQEVDRLVAAIGAGQFHQIPPASDISEMVRTGNGVVEMGRQLSDHAARLQQAVHVRDRFLDSMSHEIRTPLNGILGLAQMLGFDGNLTPEQREHLRLILASGERLLLLLDSVMMVSQLESGAIHPRRTRIMADDLLAASVQRLASEAAVRSIALMVVPAPGVQLETDPALTGRALELMLQAALHVEGVQRLTVELRSEPPQPVVINLLLSCAVPDAAVLEHLFETDASGARNLVQDGTSFGLAIAARMAATWGGQAEAQAHPQGWMMAITL
jgi:signal transduction histidine kinase